MPFPHALDQDQAANAATLSANGAAETIAQKDFSPQWLAARFSDAIANPGKLEQAAIAARAVGVSDAAEKLADLVMSIAR